MAYAPKYNILTLTIYPIDFPIAITMNIRLFGIASWMVI